MRVEEGGKGREDIAEKFKAGLRGGVDRGNGTGLQLRDRKVCFYLSKLLAQSLCTKMNLGALKQLGAPPSPAGLLRTHVVVSIGGFFKERIYDRHVLV